MFFVEFSKGLVSVVHDVLVVDPTNDLPLLLLLQGLF